MKRALTALAASVAFLPTSAWAQPAPPAGAPPMVHGGQQMQMRHVMPGPTMRRFHWQRINRGGMVPHFWFGPRFHVNNWQMYGFPAPMGGGRWVRYYDDALLIDRDGRVRDGRYGFDWDRYEDDWDYDERGVPGRRGHEMRYDDDDRDGEWSERWDGHDGRGEVRRERYVRRLPPPPPPPYGYDYGGYGYGYGGYGYGGMTVTETITTTTTPAVVESRTYYETVTEKVRPRVRRAPRPRCNCAPARPRPGERG